MSSATPNDPFSRLTAHADSPSDGAADPPMQVEYRGTPGPLFLRGLKTAWLTLVTLGLTAFGRHRGVIQWNIPETGWKNCSAF